MTPLAQAISVALVQFVWQGFLVSLFVSAALFVLRNRGPEVRYAVCCAGLIALAALPVVTAITIYDPLAEGNTGPAAITLTIRAMWKGSAPAAARWLSASQPWILRSWILGVAFFSLRLAWLGVRISVLRRSGNAADARIVAIAAALAYRMGTSRVVRVLVSSIPDGPSVAGWIRPAILLPAATILNLPPEHLEAILAHEIAHLRRYDDIVNIAQSVVETLLFYHPAVWWVSNRIRHERELCCDDLAVRTCGDSLCYARALTALEKLRVVSPQMALGALGMADPPLEYRIRRLVGARAGNSLPSTVPGMLALGLALTCAAIYSGPVRASASTARARVDYPESARENGIEGTVPVRVIVDGSGRVSDAKALGGPRELRRAAVESASAMRFAPDSAAGTQQVNVDFQLIPPVPSPPAATQIAPAPSAPAATGPKWVDEGESNIGVAANDEKDPGKRLALLKEWKREYPNSAFAKQRTLMTARALLSVLGAAYGKPATNAEALNAGKQAGLELLDNFEDYFDDSVRPDSLEPERWAELRKLSGVQIHSVFAYIAQVEMDDATAEAEFRKVIEVDPEQASASYQLGSTIIREMAKSAGTSRYPEALYEFARALSVTGPNELTATDREAAGRALKQHYVNYHGGEQGIDDLIAQTAAGALPPAGFRILSVAEVYATKLKTYRDGYPDLELWASIKAGLQQNGEDYFQKLRDVRLPAMFRATVVSRLSANEVLVSVDHVASGDAILRFTEKVKGRVRPGTEIQFRGVIATYAPNPYMLTFEIREPRDKVVGIRVADPKRRSFLARWLKGIFRVGSRLV